MQDEQWKPITDFPDYAVSNCGRVKRITYSPFAGGKEFRKPTETQFGYLQFGFRKDGKLRVVFAHRLVACAFLERPSDKHVVNHKDGNKHNNHVDNLEWVTMKYNSFHSFHVLNHKAANGERLPQSRLTENDVIKIRNLYSTGNYSQKELSEMFSIASSHISNIVSLKKWKHVK